MDNEEKNVSVVFKKPVDADAVRRATQIMQSYKQGKANLENKIIENEQWWKLRQMEKEYYLQIVTGERDIDAFDEFVTKWYENGGETITQEVREAVR